MSCSTPRHAKVLSPSRVRQCTRSRPVDSPNSQLTTMDRTRESITRTVASFCGVWIDDAAIIWKLHNLWLSSFSMVLSDMHFTKLRNCVCTRLWMVMVTGSSRAVMTWTAVSRTTVSRRRVVVVVVPRAITTATFDNFPEVVGVTTTKACHFLLTEGIVTEVRVKRMVGQDMDEAEWLSRVELSFALHAPIVVIIAFVLRSIARHFMLIWAAEQRNIVRVKMLLRPHMLKTQCFTVVNGPTVHFMVAVTVRWKEDPPVLIVVVLVEGGHLLLS
mmetsp:Transcript_80111/g.111267  ORF Transcript_80111/g.111267 Transcript_80111/m.111267 type:complete len:273 (+) Transcript_80111:471-1289(+)